MRPLTADELRASFANCSKGEAGRLPLPRQLEETRWEDLDFLGWKDPGAPSTAYLVSIREEEPVGLVLRAGSGRGASRRQNMCALCATVHSSSDVTLMVAPRAGKAGRQGNSVGTYLCADLACSLYARQLRRPARVQPVETLDVEARVRRLRENLDHFVRRVLSQG